MKIGIDLSQIVYKGSGVSRYLEGLVKAILSYEKKNTWYFFFSSLRQNFPKELERKIKDKGFIIKKYKIPSTLLSFLWNDLHIYNIENIFNNLDWFITSDWTEPPSKTINKATVIHDLVFKRYPKTVNKKILQVQQKRLSWVKKETSIIFADSKSTKKDLINYFKINSKKINVIYPGVSLNQPNKKIIDKTLSKFSLNQPFILTVGKIEPRKNIKSLIKAYNNIKGKKPILVIVGLPGWGDLSFKETKNIKFLGYVKDKELSALYTSCLFFIFPSIWEGFGYPLVEAMKLGTPITASNTSSLKEIGEKSVLLFNPLNSKSIKKALKTMINDHLLRKQLSEKGKIRAKQFNWENTYNQIINVLKNK